jgi:preprotein translocase subunit SecE
MGVRIPPPVQKQNNNDKIINYISEAFEELKTNVTWPEWAEVQKLTIVVAVFSVVFALATWGVDEVFAKAWQDSLIG